MISKMPIVSVIMANYNGGDYLKLAVNSILDQSYTNFEFIIIDDCSTNKDYEYVSSINDARITIMRNEKNLGQTRTLNKALSFAKGRYIARMDSDDISLPNRLQLQVDYLEDNPDVMLLGGQAYMIDSSGRRVGTVGRPRSPNAVWAYSFLSNPFVHSSIMMRSTLFFIHGYQYDEEYINQDFELWSRVLVNFKGANLDSPVLEYRQHHASMTYQYYDENIRATAQIIAHRLERENLSDAITRQSVLDILRYLFVERSYADEQGVDRLLLAKKYWLFSKKVLKKGKGYDEFFLFVVLRVLQSGIYPCGRRHIVARFLFLLQIMLEAPREVIRIACWGVWGRVKGSKHVE